MRQIAYRFQKRCEQTEQPERAESERTMKFYVGTGLGPNTLLYQAESLLINRGYLTTESPFWRLARNDYHERPMMFGAEYDPARPGYYVGEVALYTSPTWHTVTSPFAPGSNAVRQQHPDLNAATFDQWGLMIGAMLTVADSMDVPLRFVGSYDPLSKRAPKRDDGSPFRSSKALFDHVTMNAYVGPGVDLTCSVHRWERATPDNGVNTCRKCGRTVRFGG